MIAIDTNVVVRFLTRDDEAQFCRAREIFRKGSVHIPDTVILESAWVLRYAYGFDSVQICHAFRCLFGLPSIHLRDPMAISLAIDWHQQGLDFADAIHLALIQECSQLLSFDRKFVKRATGLRGCEVAEG